MLSRASLIALAALLVAGPAIAQGDRHTLTGDDVALYNIAGVVRIEPGTGSNVVAEVTRLGADRDRLRVEASGRALRVVYPSDRIVYPPLGRNSETELQVREDGTFSDGWARNGRRVRITGDGTGLEAHADMLIQVPAGKTVAVYLAVGRMSATNVNGRLTLDVASADVEVTGTRGSLLLDLGSGDVSVTNAEGELTFDTGSGNVTVTDLRASTLDLDTGSGNITGRGVRADRIRLDAGSGDIRLEEVSSSDLTLDTGSGEVEISLTSDVERLTLDSGSGDVTIRAPANLGARVDIETGSGRVSGDLISGLQRRGDDEDHVSGTIGDGRGTITVETGSGDVSFLSRR